MQKAGIFFFCMKNEFARYIGISFFFLQYDAIELGSDGEVYFSEDAMVSAAFGPRNSTKKAR